MKSSYWEKPAPLEHTNFRNLWLGQALSTLGDRFSTIAIPILIYSLTDSTMQLGLAFVTQTVASTIFGLLAGALTDRWQRLRTMIVADLLRSILILLIPLSLLLDTSQFIKVGIVYALSFAVSAVGQFFVPSKIATIPQTVPEAELMEANSLDQGTSTFMGFVGYAAAGFLIEYIGVSAAFIVDAATFLISAVLIKQIKLAPEQDDGKQNVPSSVLADIQQGLRFVWDAPLLRATAILSLLAPMGIGATQPLILLFATDTIGTGEAGYGLIQAAISLGIAIGIIVVGRFASDVSRGRLLGYGVLGFGAGHVIVSIMPLLLGNFREFSPNILLTISLPLFMIAAAANGSIFLGIRTIVQEGAPADMIGRVFSVVSVLSSASLALGAATAGLADIFGIVPMLVFWSLFLVAMGIGSLRAPSLNLVAVTP